MKKAVLAILVCCLAASCAVNPVTGKKELSLISEQQELAIGEETDGQVRGQYGVYADDPMSGYVTASGKDIAVHTHLPNLPYRFAVLDSPVINAFAVPGGYVYLTRGILALMNSEAEMAVVLGHELGHVNARHSVRKMSQMILFQAGLAIGSAISDTFAKISGIAGIGVSLLFLKFSRDDEREADALGVAYARSAGYDPSRMVDFFDALERMGDLSGKNSLPGFLSTHPLTKERVRNVRALLQASDSKLIERDEEYARRIDGIVYGDDPRQGFVEGNAFYHPQLRVTCEFPDGWKVQNAPARVTILSPDDEAAVVLQAEKSPDGLSAYAKKKSASLDGGQFVNEQSMNIHGLSCVRQVFDVVKPEKETLRVQFSFIRNGERIYTFSALSKAINYGRRAPEFGRIVDSFQELRDPARLNKQPQRLRLVRADGAQSLREIFGRAGMKKDLWPSFTVMNDLGQEAVPPKGRLIKTVR
jgi:predicted Zn-dependent protease